MPSQFAELPLMNRDRLIVTGALAGVVVLSWIALAMMALDMPDPGLDANAIATMRPAPWTVGYFTATFIMWVIMMAGMMVPSAAPAILLFDALQRHAHPGERGAFSATAQFTVGYLATWTVFSLAATFAQWGLSAVALLSAAMVGTSPALGGVLFIAAGIYQLTPLKNACLRQCRSPAQFLVQHRRTGRLGPFLMGLKHGAYCTGCCWVLMALLFTFGVMNLLWVAMISVFVLIEKLVPGEALIAKGSALLMMIVGGLLLTVG